ncbi:MAG: alkaline phosphatase family protein [Deltaproteobacteria bacterium]|nr:alkaline phosphatase family protein [Deltaproteobacteria bacterium]
MEFFRTIDPVWLSLGPVLVINLLLIASLLYFLATRKDRPVPAEVQTRHNSKFLSATLKHWWYWNNEPIARGFVKCRATPNVLTFIGFLFSIVAAFFYAKGLYGFAGWTMLFGGTFDLFDGHVARITGKSTKSGAFFDSVMDRFSEGIVFLGLALCFKNSWVLGFLIAGLIGSMAVSYTRARGEAIGVAVKKGSMQRPERLVYLGCASIFEPITSYGLGFIMNSPPPYLVIVAIVLIGIMTNVTAVYRMIFVMNILDSAEKKRAETIPQKLTKIFLMENRYGYDRSRARFRLVLLLMVDGAHPEVLSALIREGRLPHIARRFAQEGLREDAVTCFPSASGPAYTPFVTGCFPGTCDVPGIRWFDRTVDPDRRLTTKRFRDYFGKGAYLFDFDLSKRVKTIYEYSRQAYNILGMVNRGCGPTRDPAFFAAPLLFYRAKKQNNLETVEATAFRWFLSSLKRDPDFIFYFFPSIDLLTHRTHKDHRRVIQAYERLDRTVGQMEKALKETGLSEETCWLLASDHGHSEVQNHFDLEEFLEGRFPTLYYPKSFRGWQEARAVNMVTGNGMSHVYLRKGQNWDGFHFMEDIEKQGLPAALLERKEVDILLGRSQEGGIQIVSRRGRARLVEDPDGRISYKSLGSDPFGFEAIPAVMDMKETLALTDQTPYPDALVQAAQLFRSKRSGDLVISASLGSDLRNRFEIPPHQSGHGSLNREHMRVPFYVSPKLDLKPGPYRTADIFTLVLDLMGIEPGHDLDGRAILSRLKQPGAATQCQPASR